MAELIGKDDFEFARVIEAAGRCPDSFFFRIALNIPTETLRRSAMPLTVGALMARSGFYLCEKWDSLSYHEFVQCIGLYVLKETKRVAGNGCLDRAYMPYRHMIRGHGFVEEGDRLICEGWRARPVAWGLIHDGLRLSREIEPEHYPALLGGMTKFLVPEIERTKRWRRVTIPLT